MDTNNELSNFVRESLVRGIMREEIRNLLERAGWESSQVKSVMNSYAEIDFPIPVPNPKPYLSARDTFLYLLLFSMMYTSAFNFGYLMFEFINRALPDVISVNNYASGNGIRWAVSSLIISFPIFLYLSRLLNQAVMLDPSKRSSKVRKWLTYMTMYITSSCLIIDLTTLVFNLLSGGLSLRFLLKALTIGVIASVIGGYYLLDLRQEEAEAYE